MEFCSRKYGQCWLLVGFLDDPNEVTSPRLIWINQPQKWYVANRLCPNWGIAKNLLVHGLCSVRKIECWNAGLLFRCELFILFFFHLVASFLRVTTVQSPSYSEDLENSRVPQVFQVSYGVLTSHPIFGSTSSYSTAIYRWSDSMVIRPGRAASRRATSSIETYGDDWGSPMT